MPGFFRRFALATLAMLLGCTPAFAWDAGTHREITYLAIQTLPPSPLKNLFINNLSRLEYFSVQPDVIRAKYGDQIRENPPLHRSRILWRRSFRCARSGPQRDEQALRSIDAASLRHSAMDDRRFLECVRTGVVSRRLQRTASTRGIPRTLRRRRESAAAYHRYITTATRATAEFICESNTPRTTTSVNFPSPLQPQTHLVDIDSVWQTAIAEIRDSNSHVAQLLQADRAARRQSSGGPSAYDDALMSRARPMLAGQIARAASVLASIWLYEWKRAGSPAGCAAAHSNPVAPPALR